MGTVGPSSLQLTLPLALLLLHHVAHCDQTPFLFFLNCISPACPCSWSRPCSWVWPVEGSERCVCRVQTPPLKHPVSLATRSFSGPQEGCGQFGGSPDKKMVFLPPISLSQGLLNPPFLNPSPLDPVLCNWDTFIHLEVVGACCLTPGGYARKV